MPRLSKALGDAKLAAMLPAKLAFARSLIGQLAQDTAGNTLGIALATIILLMSLVGSGTDLTRAYLTKTSLQNACDAGVLAGRKAMTTSGTYGTAETAKANKMFNFNFNPDATNASSISFNTVSNATGAVSGTATTTMPTAIMGFFGFKSIDLAVACSAEMQIASADVMFVLDTSGSMSCNPDGTNCNNGSTSKIQGVRDAVSNFYKTVAAAVQDPTNARIRFAFVPYAQTINLSWLWYTGAMPMSYFADRAPFQTKLAYFNTPVYDAPVVAPPVTTTETYSTGLVQSTCNDYGNNKFPIWNGKNPESGGGPAPKATTSTSYSYKSWTQRCTLGICTYGTCVRNKTVTTTNYTGLSGYTLTNYRFGPATIDVSKFKDRNSVPIASTISTSAKVPSAGYYDMPTLGGMVGTSGVSGITNSTAIWSGCMEERATVQSLSMSPVPSGATDLDLDSEPTDDSTRWKMTIAGLEWLRTWTATTNLSAADYSAHYGSWIAPQISYCPTEARQFTTIDTTNPSVVPDWLTTYLNKLSVRGGTYHDIGMIWAGRLASPTGMFQSNVNLDSTKYNSVSRHIIFMTDGLMSPTLTGYTAYGTEILDNRIAPPGVTDGETGTLADYHNARFLAVCEKVKNLGYTVWVIGFGTALTSQMTSCATAGRAYYAADNAALNDTFRYIAGQVSDLRINK